MKLNRLYDAKSIATIYLVAMFFSCANNANEVKELFVSKNLPIGVVKNFRHMYKDSEQVSSKLESSLMKDFSNREHPYNEFPEGIKIVSYKNNGKDSVTITGDYALSYLKTQISEIRGHVVIVNHTDGTQLETDQLFWDETTNYFFSEKKFILTSETNTILGIGFESKQDLTEFLAKKMTGEVETIEE